MKTRILIASNRLPVSISQESGTLSLKRSNGGLATAMASMMNNYDALWFGWPGTPQTIRRWQLQMLGADHRLRPVNISEDLVDRYYDQMSNGVLWPLLHGFDAATSYTDADWKAYRQVNLKFARSLAKNAKPKDTIWIHDYHLLLVPGMLRDLGVANRIGFFLHTPFARPDCLAELRQSAEVLASMAAVDIAGFQTERDSTAFTQALQDAGIKPRQGATIQAFPIGVDFDAYNTATSSKGMRKEMAKALPTITGKQVVLSISRLDYTKGILEQLAAYEAILKQPVTTQPLLYKLIVAPSREDAAGYRELRQAIEKTVARINRTYGSAQHKPIDFTYRNCGFEEVSAWYALADTLLVTPRIDGMNLVVKEYVATRQDGQGALVLSNSIGAAHQLTDAILVKPLDVPSITDGLRTALSMPPEERAKRWQGLRANVRDYDVYWWLNTFITQLQPKALNAPFSSAIHQQRTRLSSRFRSPRMLDLIHASRLNSDRVASS
jgi:trehalose 6-phosphate synthase/phosphatase